MDIGLRPSKLGDRDGIALVITLIMLAVITFMAVTFLVLSQRERSSVSTAMDQKIARDASDTAFSRVSAELLTRMMLHTNFQDFDLLVSTNYYNSVGLNNTFPAPLSPTNVNYDYLNGGGQNPLSNPQDAEINIASLLYNPRPPVYVITNAGTGQEEFRYYLDLNRNGRFDKNGNWPVVFVNSADQPVFIGTNSSGATVTSSANLPPPVGVYLLTNHFVGDPEWIGVLARPWEMHSADNQFISRYAYLVIPAGKTLDVNTMHNQAVTKSVTFPWIDGYMRNQGVGPWELNLAAFLTDLNTNIWPAPLGPAGYNPPAGSAYDYERPFNFPNRGLSFQDAFSVLRYRYNYNYFSLFSASRLFSDSALTGDNIDEYSDGPIMTTTTNIVESPADAAVEPWAGAENTNHYFGQQDFFNRAKTQAGLLAGVPGFSDRLQQAGTSNDSYNAYTFYRMLSQLGTDSQPDETKLNINYKNTDINGNVVPGMETNHTPWQPEDFFTNAANRILATMTNDMGVALSTRYIPVYPTNYYTPAVHRALQLAANIFDATTNQTVPLLAGQTNAFFPSVFRPIFTVAANGQIYISDYREATDAQQVFGFNYLDFNSASNQVGVHGNWIIYGVPWVVGAKKGLPNFNQFAFQTTYTLTRKLWFKRINNTGDTGKDYDMKQEYVMNVTNQVGMQAWNSYFSQWPASRKLRLFGTNIFTLRILNDTNPVTAKDLIGADTVPSGTNFNPAIWPGYNPANSGTLRLGDSSCSVQFLINTSDLMMNGNLVTYDPTAPGFAPGEHFNEPVVRSNPQFYMYTTNRMVYALIDESVVPHRIVDFVNLDDSGKYIDFTGIMENRAYAAPTGTTPYQPEIIWRTNGVNGPIIPQAISDGLNYQIAISAGTPVNGWQNPVIDPRNKTSAQGFNDWLVNETAPVGDTNGAPYTPTFVVTNQVSWEANDPLVHYTIPDLTDMVPQAGKWGWNPGSLNNRYQPWNQKASDDSSTFAQAIAKKDPVAGVNRLSGNKNNPATSDAWDFPTNKFWNVGILGRVHRGTPWQTVYMKSAVENQADWLKWSGDFVITTNPITGRTNADLAATLPSADYQLFDLFTTSPNPSASRGQLDVNQTNLAAWSAMLTGVNVVTNSNGSLSTYIPPAGVYDPANPTPLAKIWQGIVRTRNNTTNKNAPIFPNQTFQHVGDVLATPELTLASPFVPPNGVNTTGSDEVYERIPQQIMSLLTLNQSPRFVIYSFGQTLHPAANHPLVTGGTFNGLCTNYQITAESATRAVVRMEGTTDPKYVNGKVDSQGRSYPPHLVVEQFNVLSPD